MDGTRSEVSPSQETPLCCTHLAYETTRDVGAAGRAAHRPEACLMTSNPTRRSVRHEASGSCAHGRAHGCASLG